ncbi:AIR synthase family protein [Anoxynatronum buryatiense]|uniref:Hydrogenase expression/formation protein HypE n=1 Tax=Anoxynatronum buryatiense TaxID=489973 RepID=A0AA45WY80_9CLOT|nr:AIR synthase family protein [Anoxynatronum buryatiense]SMP62609.1 hydrogenase expression/formation protein HypE [Anoxynatronum buryatiense]
MKIGKVPVDILKNLIIGRITTRREEVLVGSAVGEDCAVLDFGDELCVISTDPITGAVAEIGSLAIDIACNDIASNGAEPVAVMMTVLAPEGTTAEDLSQIMEDAAGAAKRINVEIMGGHTEITDVVNRVLISTVALGKHSRDAMVTTAGAQEGDVVFMTKSAGLEGTAILARDMEDKLKQYIPLEILERAKALKHQISVVPEGMIAGRVGANSMHDATEGGVLGALWELAEASGKGLRIELDNIPVLPETRAICQVFQIDPYRLISSGVMVLTVSPRRQKAMEEALSEAAIPWATLGTVTQGDRVLVKDGKTLPMNPPDVDELYKALV